MEEKFSNWLLDIAKYIVTALILTTALRDTIEGWQFFVVSGALVVCIVLVGVYLHYLGVRRKKREEVQQSNNS